MLSCAENWWLDLKHLLGQLDEHAKNYPRSEAIRNGCKTSMANAAWRYPLYVNEFFMKRAKSFMATVVKKALGIDHYWGRAEFAPGRGAIHLHIYVLQEIKHTYGLSIKQEPLRRKQKSLISMLEKVWI
jgi:hypothetical protein